MNIKSNFSHTTLNTVVQNNNMSFKGNCKTNPNEKGQYFLDENGNIVPNVKINGQKATLSDGSLFSGALIAENKKGDEVVLIYKDGYLQGSYVNDSLCKTYDSLKNIPVYIEPEVKEYSRGEGVRINSFKNNQLQNIFMHLYDEQQGVKRSVSQAPDGSYKMLDIHNGRIAAKSKLKGLNLESEIFDAQGRLVKSISTQGPLTFVKEYLYDKGIIRETGSKILFDIVGTPANSYQVTKPKIIRYYDFSSDEPIRVIKTGFQDAKHYLEETKKMQDGSVRTLRLELPAGKLNDAKNRYMIFTLKNDDKLVTQAVIGEEGKNVAYNVSAKDMPKLERAVLNTVMTAMEDGIDFDVQRVKDNLPKIYIF